MVAPNNPTEDRFPRSSIRGTNGHASPDGESAGQGADTAADFRAIWAATGDAAGHGLDLAKIGGWQVGARIRQSILRTFLVLVAAAVATAVLVTGAVWSTIHLLAALSAAVGGGVLGVLLGAGVLLGTLALGVLAWVLISNRRRSLRRRSQLDPQTTESPEATELDRLRAETVAELRSDRDRIVAHGGKIFRDHPVASLGAGVATGFTATRLLAATPRSMRRSVIAAFRMVRSVGVSAILAAVLGEDDRATVRSGTRGS